MIIFISLIQQTFLLKLQRITKIFKRLIRPHERKTMKTMKKFNTLYNEHGVVNFELPQSQQK